MIKDVNVDKIEKLQTDGSVNGQLIEDFLSSRLILFSPEPSRL